VQVRPFHRSDREQLTGLVNIHVAALLPGVSLSVNAVMSQLEREPDEGIVDHWVVDRHTLVARRDDGIVAAAHLLRYGDDELVGESYRGIAEIRWAVCRHDAPEAGDAVVQAAIAHMRGWNAQLDRDKKRPEDVAKEVLREIAVNR